MALISNETAKAIAYAYREIETAEKLLAAISEGLDQRQSPDIRDGFGRHQDGLQLGVPSGGGSQRLYNVPWSLARPIIETHIAAQRAHVAALTEKARAEIGAAL